jgi:Lrp/AsnC family transcriptional regulator for asnA, asnC and gidA
MVKLSKGKTRRNREDRSRNAAPEAVVPLTMNGAISGPLALDALDRRIVQALQRDGRQSNAEISRALGAGESSVRRRIERLTEAGVIQIVAVAEPLKVGYTIYALVCLTVEHGKAGGVAARLRELREVTWLAVVAGRYDVIFAAVFEGPGDLLRFVDKSLGGVAGIVRSETFYILDMVKRAFDWRLPGMPGDGVQ